MWVFVWRRASGSAIAPLVPEQLNLVDPPRSRVDANFPCLRLTTKGLDAMTSPIPKWRLIFEVSSTVVMILLAGTLVWQSTSRPRRPDPTASLIPVPKDPIPVSAGRRPKGPACQLSRTSLSGRPSAAATGGRAEMNSQ
jgi:hypothetical protein